MFGLSKAVCHTQRVRMAMRAILLTDAAATGIKLLEKQIPVWLALPL